MQDAIFARTDTFDATAYRAPAWGYTGSNGRGQKQAGATTRDTVAYGSADNPDHCHRGDCARGSERKNHNQRSARVAAEMNKLDWTHYLMFSVGALSAVYIIL